MRNIILIIILFLLNFDVLSQNYTFSVINYSTYNKQTKTWGNKTNCDFGLNYTENGLKFNDTYNTEISFTNYIGNIYENGENVFTYSAFYKSTNEIIDVQFVIYDNLNYNATWFIYSKNNIIAYQVLIK